MLCFICLVSPVLVKVYDVLPWYVWAGEPGTAKGGYFRNFWVGCAAGTLEPLYQS